ncbi:hypothetical protein OPQ81_008042 [Rhizoctonia solani]|nr:hypothetical protein OPQ81_008042 [Rhizoctonia solani]
MFWIFGLQLRNAHGPLRDWVRLSSYFPLFTFGYWHWPDLPLRGLILGDLAFTLNLIDNDLSDDSPQPPRRPRFRRTKSAASESLYADYESDDWGDAATIHVDRDGNPIRPYDDDLEDWQRGQHGILARMRSLSMSRPNWNRVPPTASPMAYGWAARVERAGGVDDTQRRRDEERSHRPVTMPVPNPAPGPIDVRGDNDPPGIGEVPPPGVPLQPPALVRRNTRASNRPSERIRDERSATSSPKVIDHKEIRKKGPQDMIGSLKPGQLGAYTRGRHLSRVEKIAAVIQHVTSLPFMADSPVNTYYPAKEKEVVSSVEPYRMFDPRIPKRYRPPPPMPPSWYQPKPSKPKKTKQPPKLKKSDLNGMVIADDRGFPLGPGDDEFTYPDYDYSNYPYTADTPTLQSDPPTTEESDSFYDYPQMIQDIDYADLPVRPAYFPAPIKSTGLSTVPRNLDFHPRPLQIAATPYYDDYSSSESSYRPIPSPLMTDYDPQPSRAPSQHGRIPLAITYPVPPPASSSAVTVPGPPLVIPSPGGQLRTVPTPAGNLGPLPGGYSPLDHPFAKHYEAAPIPPKGKNVLPKQQLGHLPIRNMGPHHRFCMSPRHPDMDLR